MADMSAPECDDRAAIVLPSTTVAKAPRCVGRVDDAFSPLHVTHLPEYCPDAIRFLGLPPGWRFMTDGDYVDVWEDRALLDV